MFVKLKITGKTTLSEIRILLNKNVYIPEFILNKRMIRSIQQSINIEGYKVSVEQIRNAIMNIIKK